MATASIGTMRASCGDDAKCQFDVPANSSFDVVANGSQGEPLHWGGCASLRSGDRCHVEVGTVPVLVTVR